MELKRGEMAPVTVISCIVFTCVCVLLCLHTETYIHSENGEKNEQIGTMGLRKQQMNVCFFVCYATFTSHYVLLMVVINVPRKKPCFSIWHI